MKKPVILQDSSRQVAAQVMKEIMDRRITVIHCRGTLDRMIEIVKWPHTRDYIGKGGKKYAKQTVYMNKQYNTIRNFLIDFGFLKPSFDGYRYHYTVNKAALGE